MDIIYSVSDFIAVYNQVTENIFTSVTINGELSNFRISKNKWVYFDLKDEFSSLKCFGTVYMLPGPLEDGMLLSIKGVPRLHNNYGFSINILSIVPSGEGSIKKAAVLLKLKLEKEGLFDENRKRQIPYPPQSIGLITSKQSAAYSDFIKVINKRWAGLDIHFIDVQVQGDAAIDEIKEAINHFNYLNYDLDALVIIRGGGSSEDLAIFNNESIVRVIAASRIPSLVAVGHERDISLAELVADVRASTPSNAAELIAPDKKAIMIDINNQIKFLNHQLSTLLSQQKMNLLDLSNQLFTNIEHFIVNQNNELTLKRKLIEAYNPSLILKRGYSISRINSEIIKSTNQVKTGYEVSIEVYDGKFNVKVK